MENNRLDAKWIGADGLIRDKFTIMKEVNRASNIYSISGASITLTASWTGNYAWSTGETTRSINVSPIANTNYNVTDAAGCLTDVFYIITDGARHTKNVALQEDIIPATPANME